MRALALVQNETQGHTQTQLTHMCAMRYGTRTFSIQNTTTGAGTHTVGCSVFIRHAAEGCERTQRLRQITDKLNSSHSLTDGKECGKMER